MPDIAVSSVFPALTVQFLYAARTALHHRKPGPERRWPPPGSSFALQLSELLLSSCSEAVDLALMPAPDQLSTVVNV